jgi:hypothetical protein
MKAKCSEWKCENLIQDDDLDTTCFDCGYTFCSEHTDYYGILTEDELYTRREDIYQQLPNDKEYLKRIDRELNKLIKSKSKKHCVSNMLSLPLCADCFKKRIHNEK